jgi:predicted Rossmann fold flavoprotein
MRAGDVRRVLLEECRRLGADVRCGEAVTAIAPRGGRFAVETRQGRHGADAVVVAAGGSSYPATGSTGDGCGLCRSLGHTIAPIAPALVPLVLRDHPFADCAGIPIPGCLLAVYRGGRRVAQRTGDLLFTHEGLSGPGVIDLSRSIEPGDELRFSLAAAGSADRLEGDLQAAAAARGSRTVAASVAVHAVPARVLARVLAACGIPRGLRAADLDKRRRRLLAERLTAFAVVVERLAGWDEAMVTRGGVSLAEIDPATMQSRLVPGLHVAGESLDVDGDTGGYNLQAAFSTGMLAGRGAAGAAVPGGSAGGERVRPARALPSGS